MLKLILLIAVVGGAASAADSGPLAPPRHGGHVGHTAGGEQYGGHVGHTAGGEQYGGHVGHTAGGEQYGGHAAWQPDPASFRPARQLQRRAGIFGKLPEQKPPDSHATHLYQTELTEEVRYVSDTEDADRSAHHSDPSQTSFSEPQQQQVYNPYEMVPQSFHQFLDIPIHKYKNGTEVQSYQRPGSPLVSGGYAHTQVQGYGSNRRVQTPERSTERPVRLSLQDRLSTEVPDTHHDHQLTNNGPHESLQTETDAASTASTTASTTTDASTTGAPDAYRSPAATTTRYVNDLTTPRTRIVTPGAAYFGQKLPKEETQKAVTVRPLLQGEAPASNNPFNRPPPNSPFNRPPPNSPTRRPLHNRTRPSLYETLANGRRPAKERVPFIHRHRLSSTSTRRPVLNEYISNKSDEPVRGLQQALTTTTTREPTFISQIQTQQQFIGTTKVRPNRPPLAHHSFRPADDVDKYSFRPAEDVGIHSSRPADDVGKYSPRPADDVGKYSPRPADDVGKYSSRPADDVGKYSSRPADDVGKYSSRPADDVGKYSSRPADDVGKYSPRPADDVGKYSSRPADDVGKYSSRPADEVGEPATNQFSNAQPEFPNFDSQFAGYGERKDLGQERIAHAEPVGDRYIDNNPASISPQDYSFRIANNEKVNHFIDRPRLETRPGPPLFVNSQPPERYRPSLSFGDIPSEHTSFPQSDLRPPFAGPRPATADVQGTNDAHSQSGPGQRVDQFAEPDFYTQHGPPQQRPFPQQGGQLRPPPAGHFAQKPLIRRPPHRPPPGYLDSFFSWFRGSEAEQRRQPGGGRPRPPFPPPRVNPAVSPGRFPGPINEAPDVQSQPPYVPSPPNDGVERVPQQDPYGLNYQESKPRISAKVGDISADAGLDQIEFTRSVDRVLDNPVVLPQFRPNAPGGQLFQQSAPVERKPSFQRRRGRPQSRNNAAGGVRTLQMLHPSLSKPSIPQVLRSSQSLFVQADRPNVRPVRQRPIVQQQTVQGGRTPQRVSRPNIEVRTIAARRPEPATAGSRTTALTRRLTPDYSGTGDHHAPVNKTTRRRPTTRPATLLNDRRIMVVGPFVQPPPGAPYIPYPDQVQLNGPNASSSEGAELQSMTGSPSFSKSAIITGIEAGSDALYIDRQEMKESVDRFEQDTVDKLSPMGQTVKMNSIPNDDFDELNKQQPSTLANSEKTTTETFSSTQPSTTRRNSLEDRRIVEIEIENNMKLHNLKNPETVLPQVESSASNDPKPSANTEGGGMSNSDLPPSAAPPASKPSEPAQFMSVKVSSSSPYAVVTGSYQPVGHGTVNSVPVQRSPELAEGEAEVVYVHQSSNDSQQLAAAVAAPAPLHHIHNTASRPDLEDGILPMKLDSL